MTNRLLWKLLGINILVIGVVIVIVWVSVDYLAAGYFMALMEKYHISPTSSHHMFVSAVHRYLVWASLGALVLAVGLSFLLMKRILNPLTQMTEITSKIAAGDYSASVPVTSRDEVGQLALAFNRMTESLRHIEQLRKTMMIDVAHELRTPLTNIRGYLEALTDGVVSPSKETFELLQEESFRLVQLVEDILRLAKADAAKANLQKVELRIIDLVAQILDHFRAQLEAKAIEVETRFADPDIKVWADPQQLSQVIHNLLQNTWQYTDLGGRVLIFSESGPKAIKIVFANTGGELAEEDLPFIFERFYRGEKSRSRQHGGAGIGLAIVKELIEAHGGSVGADLMDNRIEIWFELPTQNPPRPPCGKGGYTYKDLV
jgi:two-component system sensor histidine kinase BaeS